MTKPFDANDRAAIVAALADTDPDNTIAIAIALKLDALSKLLEDACAKTGELPQSIEFTKPGTVLDQIVIDLFRATLRDQRDLIARLCGKHPDHLSVPEIRILDHGRQ